jgi:hypothetical protein
MLEDLEKRIVDDYHKVTDKVKESGKKMRVELNKNKKVAKELGANAKKALEDLQSGKVFTDDEAAKNLKNSILDSLKAAGMTGIFMLPGGLIGLVALRRVLKRKEAKMLGIQNLLTLTIEESEKAVKEDDSEEKSAEPEKQE